MVDDHRILLIGGSSHVGKSTTAKALATRLGWRYQTTDKLARHPGRPWQPRPEFREQVTGYYRSLSPSELLADVLRHYQDTVWPLIEPILRRTIDLPGDHLILEGSAIMPALVAALPLKHIAAIWFTANEEFLRRRIYRTSDYESKSTDEKELIDKFLVRSVRFDDRIKMDVKRLGLTGMEVDDTTTLEQMMAACLALL